MFDRLFARSLAPFALIASIVLFFALPVMKAYAIEIDLTPVAQAAVPYVTEFLIFLVIALLGWIGRWLGVNTSAYLEDKHYATIRKVATSRINTLLGEVVDGNPKMLQFSTRSDLVADIANYAVKKAPKAVNYHKLNDDDVRDVVSGVLQPSQQKVIMARPGEDVSRLSNEVST